MVFSEFFVLNLRGDTIISRDYRGVEQQETRMAELFFQHIKSNHGDAEPVFHVSDTNFMWAKHGGLYLLLTSQGDVSPTQGLELIERLAGIFRDYCGVLNEEAIRKNFVLIYELLDEAMDYGHVQEPSTESLKAFVFQVPVAVATSEPPTPAAAAAAASASSTASSIVETITNAATRRKAPPTAGNKPIGTQENANEIFVDLVERITMLFSPGGHVLHSQLVGAIQMKSFLQGTPEVRLGLNEDLAVGRETARYASVVLEDINFHECAQLGAWDSERAVVFTPPDGEFTLLNYRIAGDGFLVPFRIMTFVEDQGEQRLQLTVKVRCELPDDTTAHGVALRIPMPRTAHGVACELGGSADAKEAAAAAANQTTEFKAADKLVLWTIHKFKGGSDLSLRCKIILLPGAAGNPRRMLAPVSLAFEIPTLNCSRVQIRTLKIAERGKNYNPMRWIRNITQSDSYSARVAS